MDSANGNCDSEEFCRGIYIKDQRIVTKIKLSDQISKSLSKIM